MGSDELGFAPIPFLRNYLAQYWEEDFLVLPPLIFPRFGAKVENNYPFFRNLAQFSLILGSMLIHLSLF